MPWKYIWIKFWISSQFVIRIHYEHIWNKFKIYISRILKISFQCKPGENFNLTFPIWTPDQWDDQSMINQLSCFALFCRHSLLFKFLIVIFMKTGWRDFSMYIKRFYRGWVSFLSLLSPICFFFVDWNVRRSIRKDFN